jgi:AraC-like DNA-binding protein
MNQTSWMSVRGFRHAFPMATSMHAHYPGQLIAVASGLLTVETHGQRLVVPANCALWIPPGQLHGYRAAGPHAGWSVHVEPGCAAHLPADNHVVALSGLLREALERAAAWPASQVLYPSQEDLATVIIDEMDALPRETLAQPWPAEARLQRIAREFSAHPADARALPVWADWAGLAPRTLSRRFVAETGLSFSEWRRRVRLLAAVTMLPSGRPVTAMALELGYDSVSAFCAMFKRALGSTRGGFSAQQRER